ncbi:class A beta-lactamase [Euryhalocaulis caribicus]|uniref:class A beta-lactamase n=1 Tax=Euryhalocaulis caribicus TaxID=1161401 RepID=UPI0003A63303|nr:class A beta-lactamase [Euryhalocaulis caribicus]
MAARNLLYAALIAAALGAGAPAHEAMAAQAPAAEARDRSLEHHLARIAGNLDGVVGVSIRDLSSGAAFGLNADEAFPMASTFKIAVAGAILEQVDSGELTLEQMVTVDPDMHVPSEIIADRFIHPGVSLSVANLMELMLTQSDNTATDVLTELAGGPAAVTGWLASIGVEGQRVDRDTAGLLRDFFQLPEGPLAQTAAAALAEDPGFFDDGLTPREAFYNDPKDTSTPDAMADLLTRIVQGEALGADSTEFLVGVMERCRTGEGRLKGLLPEGVTVAHKTGTVGGTVNDVGVMTLPGGRQVVIAVFVKASPAPAEARERTIAEIARTAYDYFLFN